MLEVWASVISLREGKDAFFIEAGAAVGGRGPLSLSSFDTVIVFGNSHEFMIQISYCHPVFESPLEISSL